MRRRSDVYIDFVSTRRCQFVLIALLYQNKWERMMKSVTFHDLPSHPGLVD